MERSRTVPVGTMPDTKGDLDECGGALGSARVEVGVSVGWGAGCLDKSGEKMREVERIERPRC